MARARGRGCHCTHGGGATSGRKKARPVPVPAMERIRMMQQRQLPLQLPLQLPTTTRANPESKSRINLSKPQIMHPASQSPQRHAIRGAPADEQTQTHSSQTSLLEICNAGRAAKGAWLVAPRSVGYGGNTPEDGSISHPCIAAHTPREEVKNPPSGPPQLVRLGKIWPEC